MRRKRGLGGGGANGSHLLWWCFPLHVVDPSLNEPRKIAIILALNLRLEPIKAGDRRPEQVALASGRPVLIVPYAGHFDNVGRRVLIAWNATREAARAVSDAMPLLTSAELVTVLTIDPREGPHGHGELPGADIALHLARHGVKAQIERTVSAGMPVGEVLLSRVADLGADLIVMGAYGHSRAREVLLGGATRSVLRSMTVPVLMSH
jgi:nucleotide-binding universal stress UspA family protein